MKSASEYSNLKIEGSRIELTYDGVLVTGSILRRERYGIEVSLESPFSGISEESAAIPLPALVFKDYTGKAGDKKAADLLCDLYRFCVYANENIERLKQALIAYRHGMACVKFFSPESRQRQERITSVLKNIKDLRKALREGNINNVEYQQQLKPVIRDLHHLNAEAEIDTEELFAECFRSFRCTPVEELRSVTVIEYLFGKFKGR